MICLIPVGLCPIHGQLGLICGVLVLYLGILGWDMVYFSTGSWIFFLVANGFQFILICVVRLTVPIGKIACSLF